MKTKTTIVQGIFQEVDANQISTVFITGDIVEVIMTTYVNLMRGKIAGNINIKT